MIVQKSADRPATAEQFQQDQSRGHRRHDERQRDESFDERFARPIITRQQPSHPQAKRQNDQGAQSRNPRGEPNDLQFFATHDGKRYLRTMKPNSSKTFAASGASRKWRNFFAASVCLAPLTTAIG